MFIDPDGSTHYYKEFEINALNTTWDLELNKVCWSGGGHVHTCHTHFIVTLRCLLEVVSSWMIGVV